MSQTHRHAVYFWISIIAVVGALAFTCFKLDTYISLSKSEKELERSLSLVRSHERASSIIKARNILTELSTKDPEFKQAQALCMKDVESVKPSKDHSFIYQSEYCRDRAIKYMGYDTTYKELKEEASRPIPSGIIIKGI